MNRQTKRQKQTDGQADGDRWPYAVIRELEKKGTDAHKSHFYNKSRWNLKVKFIKTAQLISIDLFNYEENRTTQTLLVHYSSLLNKFEARSKIVKQICM